MKTRIETRQPFFGGAWSLFLERRGFPRKARLRGGRTLFDAPKRVEKAPGQNVGHKAPLLSTLWCKHWCELVPYIVSLAALSRGGKTPRRAAKPWPRRVSAVGGNQIKSVPGHAPGEHPNAKGPVPFWMAASCNPGIRPTKVGSFLYFDTRCADPLRATPHSGADKV